MRKLLMFTLVAFAYAAGVVAQTKSRIAFGSCSRETAPNELWASVIQDKPDLWIWLGDNIYGDTEDMALMKAKYAKQKANADYQKLRALCPIIGTWDDHDYGANDAGKEFAKKQESKVLLLDFLDVPRDADVRKHEGVYNTFSLGKDNHKIKVILLDTRYFRDPLKVSSTKDKRFEPTDEGDLLGEEQWAWLERELTNSDAAVHIIGTSIQFIAMEHGFEKWQNLSASRRRMLDLLKKTKPKHTLMISGDRHIAEISKMNVEGLPYPLYDFTASGLTHTWDAGWESNQYRVGDLIKQKNYGLIDIDWSADPPVVTFNIKGKNNTTFLTHTLQY